MFDLSTLPDLSGASRSQTLLERVENEKQIIKSATLANLLERFGFQSTGGKGSHEGFQHQKFSDITVGVVHGTGQIIYQKNVVKACRDVLQREHDLRQEQLASALAGSELRDTFTGANGQTPENRVQALEEAKKYETKISAELLEQDGQELVVLRSKKLPQIGLPVNTQVTPGEIRAAVDRIQEQVREFHQLTNMAEKEYEITVEKNQDGSLKISSIVCDFSTDTIEKYSPFSDSPAPEEIVNDSILMIMETDELGRKWLQDLIDLCEKNEKSSLKIEYQKKGENRQVAKLYSEHMLKEFGFDQSTTFEIEMTPQKRFRRDAALEFIDEQYQLNIGGWGDKKHLANALKTCLGVDIKRKGNELLLTHPFIESINHTMPLPDPNKTYKKALQRLIDACSDLDESSPEHKEKLEKAKDVFSKKVQEMQQTVNEIRSTIDDVARLFLDYVKELHTVVDTNLIQQAQPAEGTSQLRLGRVFSGKWMHPLLGNETIHMEFILLRKFSVFEKSGLKELADKLDQAQAEVKPEKNTPEPGASSGPMPEHGLLMR